MRTATRLDGKGIGLILRRERDAFSGGARCLRCTERINRERKTNTRAKHLKHHTHNDARHVIVMLS